MQQEERQLTAQGPAPTTRAQAWVAWEAALLELQGHLGLIPITGKKTHKRFEMAVARRRLWLVAMDVRPLRGEILVEPLAGGDPIWVQIHDLPDNGGVWRVYKIIPQFPELRSAQLALWERSEKITMVSMKK